MTISLFSSCSNSCLSFIRSLFPSFFPLYPFLHITAFFSSFFVILLFLHLLLLFPVLLSSSSSVSFPSLLKLLFPILPLPFPYAGVFSIKKKACGWKSCLSFITLPTPSHNPSDHILYYSDQYSPLQLFLPRLGIPWLFILRLHFLSSFSYFSGKSTPLVSRVPLFPSIYYLFSSFLSRINPTSLHFFFLSLFALYPHSVFIFLLWYSFCHSRAKFLPFINSARIAANDVQLLSKFP